LAWGLRKILLFQGEGFSLLIPPGIGSLCCAISYLLSVFVPLMPRFVDRLLDLFRLCPYLLLHLLLRALRLFLDRRADCQAGSTTVLGGLPGLVDYLYLASLGLGDYRCVEGSHDALAVQLLERLQIRLRVG